MKKLDTTNTFNEGLIMDLNPLVTPNNVLVNCLNGTLTTFSGNENVLLNDMGNGRVETAYLPEGYVPLGTAELGGIIYIVSYNPLIDKCQVGCFPSPERNITSDEIQTPKISVKNNLFLQDGKILNTILKVKLLSDPNSEDGIFKLNPGDKYTIYSTNNGITLNKDYISDLGHKDHKFNIDPKHVTIHIVSIGEDGKIVYLDDSLKWTGEDGTPLHYYIKECKEGNDIQTDINDYRSLVSSAYNIFNSKVSGELALLLELKVINTFSVTWDADVEDIDGITEEQIKRGTPNKEATIHFNVNYTSDHKNINLKHIILSDSKFAGKDMETANANVKGDNIHCTLNLSARENDGTDPDITTTVSTFKYNSEGNLSDYIWNYALTPAMEFGYLDFLTQRGSINFLEIGSGKTELDEWRYFIQDKNFYLNWGLSAYPEKNKEIEKIVMTFIPFEEVSTSTVLTDLSASYEGNTEYAQYIIQGKNSYSGYFLELLPFGTVTSKLKNTALKSNYLYLVDICINYGKKGEYEHRHNYKWLYTTKLWNEIFVHNSNVKDFHKELSLNDVLKFSPSFDINDKIGTQIDTRDSEVTFPRSYNETNLTYGDERLQLPYAAAGAQVTTVNLGTPTSGQKDASVEVGVRTDCISYPELFLFKKTSNDTYKFGLGKSSITHDEFIPKSDTRESSLAVNVISKVKKPDETTKLMSIDSDLKTTIQTILNEGIRNETIDNKAKDLFKATLRSKATSFDLILEGAIFSRINADLLVKPVSIGLEIRPFLYYKGDYTAVGLNSPSAFSETFEEWHGDGGGGKPFFFKFTSSGGLNHKSSKENWNPSDEWSRSNWWDDIPPYNNYLNPLMIAAQGSFQVMTYHGGLDTSFNEKKILGRSGLWARTSENHYVPINCFGDISTLANIVANLYALLYYVNTDTVSKDLPVVININYLPNYTETWNVGVTSKLILNNILDNILLVYKTGSMSLSTLLNNCEGLPIELNNITRESIPSMEFEEKIISHSFFIKNMDLYNLYEDLKSTNIPAVALLSTKETWEKCSPKTLNKLYVHKKGSKTVEFETLNLASSKYLTFGGTLREEDIDNESRIILSAGTTNIYSAPIYGCFLVSNGVITLLLNKLLAKKYNMKFQTDSHGDPWSIVENNSGYGLINSPTYEK